MAEAKNGKFSISVKALDTESGTFEGLLSTYGNVDRVGDVCEKGCFERTVAAQKVYPLLWQHDMTRPIGHFEVVDTDQALSIKGTLNLRTSLGTEAYELLKAGDISGLSIGYTTDNATYDNDGIRHIFSATLYEGSLVTIPANPCASVTDVKSAEGKQRKALKDLDCLSGLSDEDREKAVKEIEEWIATEAEASEDEADEDTSAEDQTEDDSKTDTEDEEKSDSEDSDPEKETEQSEDDDKKDEEKSWTSVLEILNKRL